MILALQLFHILYSSTAQCWQCYKHFLINYFTPGPSPPLKKLPSSWPLSISHRFWLFQTLKSGILSRYRTGGGVHQVAQWMLPSTHKPIVTTPSQSGTHFNWPAYGLLAGTCATSPVVSAWLTPLHPQNVFTIHWYTYMHKQKCTHTSYIHPCIHIYTHVYPSPPHFHTNLSYIYRNITSEMLCIKFWHPFLYLHMIQFCTKLNDITVIAKISFFRFYPFTRYIFDGECLSKDFLFF